MVMVSMVAMTTWIYMAAAGASTTSVSAVGINSIKRFSRGHIPQIILNSHT